VIEWDEQKDVVVIGSGIAGLSAAIEAGGAGASVVVLEKMKVRGGNSRISDGGVAAPNNYLQKERGVEDSPELFCEDMLRAGLGLNHPDLVRIVAEKAADAIEWTRNVLGVKYLDRLDRFGGHSVARCLTTASHSGADFIKAQCRLLEQKNIEIRTGCRLTRFHTDSRGLVEGVEVLSGYKFPDAHGGIVKNIRANRSIVLASGGFGNDVRFRRFQNPGLNESVDSTNHRGATAEGLISALALKAVPVHLSWIQMGPWGCPDEKGYGRAARFASYSVYRAGILLDPATGQRIVNEWADRKRRSDALLKAGHACVGIVDAAGAELDTESLQHCLKKGYVRGFITLAELAAAFAFPDDQLEATVERYNQAVIEGKEDPLGKPLGSGAKPLLTPPFYAIRLWPKVHYTSGGVGINSKAQVLDFDNKPIPHLFAAGEVCGGIHGASRLGCCALTECIVFGRIAGQRASV
jgi:flavocytochrome c